MTGTFSLAYVPRVSLPLLLNPTTILFSTGAVQLSGYSWRCTYKESCECILRVSSGRVLSRSFSTRVHRSGVVLFSDWGSVH